MTHRHLFAVRLLRAMTFGTRRALPGADVQLDAATAAELIRDGRGRLTDEADLGPLIDAVAAGRRPVAHDVRG